MIYRIKAVIRWVRYHMRVGVSYHRYDPSIPGGVVEYGYLGYYNQFGQTISFRKTDNTMKWVW